MVHHQGGNHQACSADLPYAQASLLSSVQVDCKVFRAQSFLPFLPLLGACGMRSWYSFDHFLVVLCHRCGFRKEPKHYEKLKAECAMVKTFSELEEGGAGMR